MIESIADLTPGSEVLFGGIGAGTGFLVKWLMDRAGKRADAQEELARNQLVERFAKLDEWREMIGKKIEGLSEAKTMHEMQIKKGWSVDDQHAKWIDALDADYRELAERVARIEERERR